MRKTTSHGCLKLLGVPRRMKIEKDERTTTGFGNTSPSKRISLHPRYFQSFWFQFLKSRQSTQQFVVLLPPTRQKWTKPFRLVISFLHGTVIPFLSSCYLHVSHIFFSICNLPLLRNPLNDPSTTPDYNLWRCYLTFILLVCETGFLSYYDTPPCLYWETTLCQKVSTFSLMWNLSFQKSSDGSLSAHSLEGQPTHLIFSIVDIVDSRFTCSDGVIGFPLPIFLPFR